MLLGRVLQRQGDSKKLTETFHSLLFSCISTIMLTSCLRGSLFTAKIKNAFVGVRHICSFWEIWSGTFLVQLPV